MKAWLRQHRYALGVTLRRLALQPFSSLANILVLALALSVPLLGLALLQSAQPIAAGLATGPEITVFLQPAAPASAAPDMAARLEREHAADIAATQVVTRDQALARLRQNPAWSEALAALPSNPLPDAVIVTLSGSNFAQRAGELSALWKTWPQVDNIQLDSEWVRRLQALLQFGEIGLFLLAAGVAIIVLATVFNTVRMQALSQREEITVARLVGATENFVRRPFLYLGAMMVGVAGVLAIGVCLFALYLLNDAVGALARSYGSDFLLRMASPLWLIAMIAGFALLGALSALWSVSRNTRY